MSYQLENGTLLRAAELTPGVFDWTLSAPQIAAKARPGQFVNVHITRAEPFCLHGELEK